MTNVMSAKARRLRRDMTDAEKRVWTILQRLGHLKPHFRRQAPVGPYIVDFASHSAKLIVEVDGGQHNSPPHASRDAARTSWLESQGYRVLRFWNHDVLQNSEGVATAIMHALEVVPPTPDPSPPGGGEMSAGQSPSPTSKAEPHTECAPSPSNEAELHTGRPPSPSNEAKLHTGRTPSPLMGEGRGGGESLRPRLIGAGPVQPDQAQGPSSRQGDGV